MFAASNHEHFSHVEADDRRFVFLRVSNVHQQDTNYFSTIASAISNPETIKALLYYLKRKDITKFNVRVKPKSTEQLSQKIKSLQGFDRFWYEVLTTGDLEGTGRSPNSWTTSIFIITIKVLENYKDYNKAAEKYQTLQESQVVETIKKICPTAKTGIRELTPTHRGKEQRRGIRLPSIKDARQDFCNYVGHEISWGDASADTEILVSEDTD